jgi:two-component system sensor histidine kinase CpxA
MTITAPLLHASNPHFWFDLSIALLPASVVCMVLALYLTRPITRLRHSAQRLASGDLTARASKGRNWRRDELGDLARDFDVMAAQIQVLMTAQRRFVADVSHELGAPLTRLHLALALLRRENSGQPTVALARIERETDKLSNLVQQLLLLAALEAGAWPAETLTAVAMESFCEDIVEDANFEALHANCQITGTHHEITVLVYPNLLRRAIDNILRNAIRYAPAGTEVSLDCRIDAAQEDVTIEICDSGPGVPTSMLSEIFEPFFRTDPGRESKSGGTGLGLAIASEAIRLHDGTITAHNRPGGGLQVTIKLPLRVPLAREEDLPTNLNPVSKDLIG